ncbi:RTX toxin acyltransferase family protein [Roseovarius gaetbuli]|uniref:RTX toxin-activating lysine-acyltransferase n=1 Tax=Roseovarius gaetbuli TaxID=1356575 RepID=A0A1X6YDN6_9RHOB|nr:toxin-activating lysine-acyltransferase [Roseovarius gaetbuli]SLN18158.1 RTX toxin acyltransferase family protein [Roseovarius gaetbuli]
MAVFCNDPRYQDLPGYALYLKTMPAIGFGQYAIARKTMQLADTKTVMPAPFGAVLWAKVSDALHQKFLTATQMPVLAMPDWDSGDHFWIIDSPGDQRVVGGLLDALYRQQFGEQPFHAFMIKKDGSLSTRQFGAN